MPGDNLVREVRCLPFLGGIKDGLDPSLSDEIFPPIYSPSLQNVRVARGKIGQVRRGMALWQTLPGAGRTRLIDHVYTVAGLRIRLAARGDGTAAVLYDFVEGVDTSFNATSGGTGLGGSTELRFIGVTLNDTYYFLDRFGPMRKYQETPPSGNQVRSVALPVRPTAAPGVKAKTWDILEAWAGGGGTPPYGWTETSEPAFSIEDGSGDVESPLGGAVIKLDTKTNPKNQPVFENVTGEAVPSTTIAMWVYGSDKPTHIVFRYGQVTATDFSEAVEPPTPEEWYPLFIKIGNLGTINYKQFVVIQNGGAADTYVSKIVLPGRLQGAYRWVYTHYDPALQRESEPSDISNNSSPLDLSAIGTSYQNSTAAAFQKSAALTFTSDSGTDATTTKVRFYRSGGVSSLTKDGRGLDVWIRVAEVFDYSSTLVGAHSAGATSVVVASATNLAIGDWLVIEKGTVSKEEYVRIIGIAGTTLTISNGLQYAHSSGVAVQMAVVDNVPNEQVDTSTRIYLERDDPPNGAQWIARSPDGRLWLANYDGKPTGVRVSNRATPERPTDYEVFPDGIDPVTRHDPLQGWPFEIGGDSTDERITWFGFFHDRAYAFTRRNLYSINALSQVDWGPDAVVKALPIGCIAGDTVVEVNGSLYWVADGPRVLRWDGRSGAEDVSHLAISETLKAAPTESRGKWFATKHSREDGHSYNLHLTSAEDERAISPLQVSGLWLYLDARLLTGAHGSAVASWTDFSGAGRHATQVDAGKQPTLLVDSNLSPNGQQLVRFDGVNDNLGRSVTMPSVANGWTIYFYGNIRANSAFGTAIFGDDTSLRPLILVDTNTSPRGYGWEDALGGHNKGVFAAGFQHLTWVFNPPAGTGLGEVFKNGLSLGTAVWSWNPAISGGFIVSGNSVTNIVANADYGLMMLFTNAHDADTRAGIHAWIESVFG